MSPFLWGGGLHIRRTLTSTCWVGQAGKKNSVPRHGTIPTHTCLRRLLRSGAERSPSDVPPLVRAGRLYPAIEQSHQKPGGELQASLSSDGASHQAWPMFARKAITDPLTNIANRKAFEEAGSPLAAMVEDCEPLPCCCDDKIDHFTFKDVSTNLGPQTGGSGVRLVAQLPVGECQGRDQTPRQLWRARNFRRLLLRHRLESRRHQVANQIRTTVDTKKR